MDILLCKGPHKGSRDSNCILNLQRPVQNACRHSSCINLSTAGHLKAKMFLPCMMSHPGSNCSLLFFLLFHQVFGAMDDRSRSPEPRNIARPDSRTQGAPTAQRPAPLLPLAFRTFRQRAMPPRPSLPMAKPCIPQPPTSRLGVPQCGIQKPRFPFPPQPVLQPCPHNPCLSQPCFGTQYQGGIPQQPSQETRSSDSPNSMTGVAPPSSSPPSLVRQKAEIPQHWSQDPDFLDAARTVGNLTLPRYVQPTVWAKSEGIAGLPVAELQLHQFLYQAWNSYWLRHFAHGREGYVCITKNKGELVLVNEFLSLLRNKGIDIEAAAVHLASQNQGNLAKNIAMKGLALHLAGRHCVGIGSGVDRPGISRHRS